MLTGINIGVYRDPGAAAGLPELVRAVGALAGLVRLRVSSIEPAHVTADLVAAMAATPILAPHLHVPLQSGSDAVLRAMRRRYTAADYTNACRRARAALPEPNLTTDAIAGFPGETDADADATGRVAEELAMGKVHVFPYSARPGTEAAGLPAQLAHDVVRARAAALRALSDRLGRAHRLRRVGSRDEVLLERVHPDGALGGLGRDYTRFVLPPGSGSPGDLVPVRVGGLAGDQLAGVPR